MKLKITVTQEDIDNGIRSNGHFCPIAKACSRLGYRPNALPDHIELHCQKTGQSLVGKTPPVAREFMGTFDSIRHVEPFEFEMEFREHQIDPMPLKGESNETANQSHQE